MWSILESFRQASSFWIKSIFIGLSSCLLQNYASIFPIFLPIPSLAVHSISTGYSGVPTKNFDGLISIFNKNLSGLSNNALDWTEVTSPEPTPVDMLYIIAFWVQF